MPIEKHLIYDILNPSAHEESNEDDGEMETDIDTDGELDVDSFTPQEEVQGNDNHDCGNDRYQWFQYRMEGVRVNWDEFLSAELEERASDSENETNTPLPCYFHPRSPSDRDHNPRIPKPLTHLDTAPLKSSLLSLLPAPDFLSLPPVREYFSQQDKITLLGMLVETLDLRNVRARKAQILIYHYDAATKALTREVFMAKK
ncbi:hypothetical protein BDW74DRAFT_180169 [Aspergillus multicolor]|uniref:uncharacterized protein n=1 Tax=Aspergillus multicolor TaxID=41759 RepID=UPI003CCD03C0